MFVDIVILLECTQLADSLFHSFTVRRDDIDLVITTDDEEAPGYATSAVANIAYEDPQHMTQAGFAETLCRVSAAGDTNTCRMGRIV